MVAVSLYYRSISISIVVAVLLYDNRLISISIVIAVPVTVASPNGHANGPNTDPNLFCSSRYCAANTRAATTGSGQPASQSKSADRNYPDHAMLNATKDQLKAMPNFQYNK